MIIPPEELAAWTPKALRALYWDGIVRLPWVWPKDEIAAFAAHLKTYPCFNAHVVVHSDKKPMAWDEATEQEILSHEMIATVTAPGYLEFVLPLTEIASQLFGEPAKLFSCNSFWTRPGLSVENANIQVWHRDRDDRKFLALFMYGSPVQDDREGPHLYAKGSHKSQDEMNRPPLPGEKMEKILGPAGTCFLSNAYGLHVGLKPKRGERLLIWARWCVSDEPYSYKFDGLKPIPASLVPCAKPSEEMQARTKMVIDWNA